MKLTPDTLVMLGAIALAAVIITRARSAPAQLATDLFSAGPGPLFSAGTGSPENLFSGVTFGDQTAMARSLVGSGGAFL